MKRNVLIQEKKLKQIYVSDITVTSYHNSFKQRNCQTQLSKKKIFSLKLIFTLFFTFLLIVSSGDVFYVDIHEKIHVKFTYTILCSFKDPTWILCEFNFMCKTCLYRSGPRTILI